MRLRYGGTWHRLTAPAGCQISPQPVGIWDVSLYMVAPDQPRGFRGLVWDLQEWLWRATRVSALQDKAFDAMAMVALCSGAASSYLLLALALLQQGRSDASAQCGISDGATLLAVPVPFGKRADFVLLGVAWCWYRRAPDRAVGCG